MKNFKVLRLTPQPDSTRFYLMGFCYDTGFLGNKHVIEEVLIRFHESGRVFVVGGDEFGKKERIQIFTELAKLNQKMER